MQWMELWIVQVSMVDTKLNRKRIDHEILMAEQDVRMSAWDDSEVENDHCDDLVSGRGLLGRWGPNHAGDPVVTRWAKDQGADKPKVLEIILIKRKDSGELALPGGMVDAGFVLTSKNAINIISADL